MHPLDRILNTWRETAKESEYNRERHKGTAFEELCMQFLAHEKVYADRLESALPYGKWARGQGLPENEYGIDLVARRKDADGWCAIQCKMYGEGKTLPSAEVNKFMTASGKAPFTRRILIDTTGKPLTGPMEQQLTGQYIPVTHITLADLRKSTVDWDKFARTGEMVSREEIHELYPFQKECLGNVLEGLQESGSLGKVLMACGTGKTLTSLRIAEELVGSGGCVLYLVPSLALMSQTIHVWHQQARLPLRSYAVCSDAQVGRKKKRQGAWNEDEVQMSDIEMQIPPTTKAAPLAAKACSGSREAMTVVFCTYHSLPVIQEAQAQYGLPSFALALCDEAHRTATKSDSVFALIHDPEAIRADRRLYMTATPKVYRKAVLESKNIKEQKAEDGAAEDRSVLFSMHSEKQYGKTLYEYQFSRALQDGHLSDYHVVILTIPERQVLEMYGTSKKNAEVSVAAATKFIGIWRILSGLDESDVMNRGQPLRKVIAYCQTIRDSKAVVREFNQAIETYREKFVPPNRTEHPNETAADHVDGTFGAVRRNELLNWLDTPPESATHMLSNVRCLSEGLDVPELDAIIFMHPRKSQIDVVQAVGRVMRKAKTKEIGYVILPVVIRAGESVEAALKNNKDFQVVWQVCNAIRSHDESFEASINLFADGKNNNRLSLIMLHDWIPRSEWKPDVLKPRNEENGGNGDESKTVAEQLELDLQMGDYIRAKIAERVGTRPYWSNWAGDVAEIARVHRERITAMVDRNDAAQEVFGMFLDELRDDLNEGITKEDAIEMLAQHMVTRPVFEALLGGSRFAKENAISKGMQLVLDTLKTDEFAKETRSLEGLYDEVAARARQATSPESRQKIIRKLYNDFFAGAFKKTADKLGIVYTPIELVDFVLHSVDQVLQDEFGKSLGSDGVGILDPFTGTGTFITRMIQSGLIPPEQLRKKYHSEIHANEIVLLAYYITAINIEEAYRAGVDTEEYAPFTGLALTDTFDMVDRRDEIAGVMPENSEIRERQMKADIMAIVGNPPWRAGQTSQNDAALNQSYPKLHERIEKTYAQSSAAGLKRNLYDSYILAIRWASDRIGERGVIGFVTNAGWLEGIAMDGMRKCLAREFASVYVLNLRGNQRTQGERSRKEGGKVFGSGSRAPVSVLLLVKNPERTGCTIRYHDIGDYLSREEKLKKVKAFGGIQGVEWKELIPDVHHDWLNQREEGFGKFMALGGSKKYPVDVIFKNYSCGVNTGRDAWCYNYSEVALRENIRRMIRFYHAERERIIQGNTTGSSLTPAEVTRLVDNDPTKISWTRALKNDLRKNKELNMVEGRIAIAQYRPFTRMPMYFSRRLNEMVLQMPQIFPHAEAENLVICLPGKGAKTSFSCLITNRIPNLNILGGAGQCFPLWLYHETTKNVFFGDEQQPDGHGYVKESALTDWALSAFQEKMGCGQITAEDIFYYLYGVLHVPQYRTKYANNLRKELPRIPLPENWNQFRLLSEVGRKLGQLHVGYDEVEPYPIRFAKGGWEPGEQVSPEDWFCVVKMKHPSKDLTQIVYNEHITIQDIPLEAYDYVVNGKSAIGWVMDRQCMKTDKTSQIVNDANRFAIEAMQGPAYPLKLLARVIRVSLETNRIVSGLREVKFED